MNKKSLIVFALLFVAFQLFAQNVPAPHRVVIQISSNDTLVWKGLMNNIKNLKNAWNDSVAIEVVANGQGIEFLVLGKTTQQEKIGYYKSKGVVFLAC
jgi:intracellular sulfur oxidation DsrE/DsrF family protein